MIFRIMLFTLLFSINAYAKPIHYQTTQQEKSNPLQTSIRATEDDLSKQLTSHGWQITQISKQSSFSFDADHWIFNFANDGKYKAFGTCNFLSGSFKTDNGGGFRISNLGGSNNHCNDAKDEETMIFNLLLLADGFEINGDALLLKSNGQPLINLKRSDQEVSKIVAHRIQSGDKTNKSHSKKGRKVEQSKVGKPKLNSPSKNHKTPQAKTAKNKSSAKHQVKKKV